MFTLVLLTFVANFIAFSGAQQFQSPCPSMFTYDSQGVIGDRWYGTIRILIDTELSGVWLRTIFDRPVPEIGTEFGEAVQREPAEYLIRNPKHKLKIGDQLVIRIFARFNPGDSPPKLLGFRLNGRTICPENGVIETTTPAISDLLVSPCPSLFMYETPGSETDRWYGVIQLRTERELNGVWLRIILDNPSVQLGNWFGEVTTNDNMEYLIKNRNFKLSVGSVTPLRFFIKYTPGQAIPKLKNIRLNAETVCPAEKEVSSNINNNSFTQRPFVQTTTQSWVSLPPPDTNSNSNSGNSEVWGSDFNENSRPSFIPGAGGSSSISSGTKQQCGVIAAQAKPLITYGEATVEGQWPWHAALYYSKGIDLQYICGASLITLSHVISAAHCVARRNTNTPLNSADLEVFLGKYHLRQFSSATIQSLTVKKIVMHPGYNYRIFNDDIAIIHLIRPAQFTDYVRPVCLWSESTDLNSVIEKEGTVVGWGYDENRKVTEHLTQANMPVVSHQTCIWSYPEFFSKFDTNKTFCAGFRNGTSVCNGDSGGGLVFPKRDSDPRRPVWHLRGIVSLSVALQHQSVCDSTHYAVFTDVAKYLSWILNAMQ